jgi:hypothetical protein
MALALCACGALACSFSYSSESSSDSSKHSSDSSVTSSDSSSPDRKDDDKQSSSFDQDVEQYTLAFVQAGGSQGESFFSGLGDLARQHGVSDWESDPAAWEAIGRGLARSPASTAQRTAYQTAWTGGDAARQGAVAKGISSVQ